MALPKKLNDPADFEATEFTEIMIQAWASSDEGGGLPYASARAFAAWLDSGWNEYQDPERDQTNLDILKSGLSEWTGGRTTVTVTKELRAAFKLAEQAHQDLYANVDDLAGFFTALAGAAPELFAELRN